MTLASEYGLTLRELKKISKILILANASLIENEIAKIANSNERKRIWVLIDGKRLANKIANDVGVNPGTVSRFLDVASAADLVEYTKGEPPRKLLDYSPPSWIDLVMGRIGEEESKEGDSNKNEAIEKQLPDSQTHLSKILNQGENKNQEEKSTVSPSSTKNGSSRPASEASHA
jgi:DNA-binding MarR family transcriptional regulator